MNLPPGQSYEIRLLENRKLGDFQDLNTKYVKVRLQSAPCLGTWGCLIGGLINTWACTRGQECLGGLGKAPGTEVGSRSLEHVV